MRRCASPRPKPSPRTATTAHREESREGLAQKVAGAILKDVRVEILGEPVPDLPMQRVQQIAVASTRASSTKRSLPRL